MLLGITCFEVYTYFYGPFWMEARGKGLMDYLFLAVIVFHILWGITALFSWRKFLLKSLFRIPEILFFFTLLFFLFSYIWAMNANMDYIQRLAASKGNIFLAPDSTIQRANSMLQFLPYLILDGFIIIYYRVAQPRSRDRIIPPGIWGKWGLFFSIGSALLYTFSFPSFLNLQGIPVFGYFCFVPLILVIKNQPYSWSVFYGVVFGSLQSLISNYWLGTFSLVSLQFSVLYYLVIYTVFMLIFVYLLSISGKNFPFVFAGLWTFFDYLRSAGFTGYPWVLVGVSQYQFLPLIQTASVTGIWGISFMLLLSNASIGEILHQPGTWNWSNRGIRLFTGWAGLFLCIIIAGGVYLGFSSGKEPGKTVRIALIQQNTDPRKNDYREGLNALKKLTNQALLEEPDLIAWSETAFVPNIRRWGAMEPDQHYLARLVHELLSYLKGINTWLVTGNDDYTIETDENGEETRRDYNAAILFSDTGERVRTYHKIHLVPFTEYFPYGNLFPWFYELLLNFDVNLWEPGTERVVFQHPDFSFSTPICFEDGFPNDIRKFVLEGAEVILNLSNDFWSLTKVEAKQHYVNAVFRAVENRRPLVRATASGLTSYVDSGGRLISRLPQYTEGFLIADVAVGPGRRTLYTILGDWFPYAVLLVSAFLILSEIFLNRHIREDLNTSL